MLLFSLLLLLLLAVRDATDNWVWWNNLIICRLKALFMVTNIRALILASVCVSVCVAVNYICLQSTTGQPGVVAFVLSFACFCYTLWRYLVLRLFQLVSGFCCSVQFSQPTVQPNNRPVKLKAIDVLQCAKTRSHIGGWCWPNGHMLVVALTSASASASVQQPQQQRPECQLQQHHYENVKCNRREWIEFPITGHPRHPPHHQHQHRLLSLSAASGWVRFQSHIGSLCLSHCVFYLLVPACVCDSFCRRPLAKKGSRCARSWKEKNVYNNDDASH